MATGSSAGCVLNSAGISKEWIISGFQTACNCLLKCHSQRIKSHDLGYACLHPQCGGYLCCFVCLFVCFNCLGISDMSILYLIKSTPALFPFNSFPIPTTDCPSQSQVLCDLNHWFCLVLLVCACVSGHLPKHGQSLRSCILETNKAKTQLSSFPAGINYQKHLS